MIPRASVLLKQLLPVSLMQNLWKMAYSVHWLHAGPTNGALSLFPHAGSDLQPKDAMIWITASLWANSGVFRLIYKHHQSLPLKWANGKSIVFVSEASNWGTHPYYTIYFYCYIFKMRRLKVLFSSTLKTPWNLLTTADFCPVFHA